LNPALGLRGGPANPGTFVLKCERSGARIANNPLDEGDQLVVRMTDRAALRDALEVANGTTARGAVLFRLPDSTASSGWSLRQLQHLEAGPALALKSSADGGSLILENRGDGDLPPLKPASRGRALGYILEIELPSPVLREAEQGDFSSITTYAPGAKGPRPAAAPFATQVCLAFSNLRSGRALATGLIQLAPGASFRQARWRVPSVDETWKPFE
jgi:hypothetical protein